MAVVFSDFKAREGRPFDDAEIESMMRLAAHTAAVVRSRGDYGDAVLAAFAARAEAEGDEVTFVGPVGRPKAVPVASAFPGMVMDAVGDTRLAVRVLGIDGTELVTPLEPKAAAELAAFLLRGLAVLDRAGLVNVKELADV